MKSWLLKLDKFFFGSGDPRVLAVVRIVLGVSMMFVWACLGLRGAETVYGEYGLIQAKLLAASIEPVIPAFGPYLEKIGLSYSSVVATLYWLRWAGLLAFVLGIFTRPATLLLLVLQVFIMSSGSFSNYGVDRYFHVLLFLILFMNVDEEWSLKRFFQARKGEAPPVPSADSSFALRVLQLAILIIYLDAGISKAGGHDWWTGDAVWRALHLPEFHQQDFLWMSDLPWIPRILSWGTMFLEAFYILGVWIPVIGPLWVVAVIAMHLGIAAFLGLVSFGVTLALLNFALFIMPGLLKRLDTTGKLRKIGFLLHIANIAEVRRALEPRPNDIN